MPKLLLIDIDGTLTDATTNWQGPEQGWCQRYSTRDGEALRRMAGHGVNLAALSRNRTRCARERMLGLGINIQWLGVSDKVAAFEQALSHYEVNSQEVAYIGDGPEDAQIFVMAGLGVAVADAHPHALRTSDHVLDRPGGGRAIEELEMYLEALQWWPQGSRE